VRWLSATVSARSSSPRPNLAIAVGDFTARLANSRIAKALAYAIAAIDGLPYEKQEVSDRDEMVALLLEIAPKDRDLAILDDGVEQHLGRRPNLINHKIMPQKRV
jgi:hypothetical protein